jgi:hypothetical protein
MQGGLVLTVLPLICWPFLTMRNGQADIL